MERRYQVRLKELLDAAVLRPEQLEGMLARLEQFVKPFALQLTRQKQRLLTQQYVAGLISHVERKNVESIAYHYDQDRQALQKFIGQYTWDHRPLIHELVRQVGESLGCDDAVLVLDPSSFRKQGNDSVGVKCQWCGRYGKIMNCQVGVYLAYASAAEQALVDMRLYLPKEWARSKALRRKCGVPATLKFQTRAQLALEMVEEHSAILPHRWVTGDEEFGHSAEFRGELHRREQRYLLTIAATTKLRDMQGKRPPYSGAGATPLPRWTQADLWCAKLPESAWTKVNLRPGERAPSTVEVVTRVVHAKAISPRREEILIVVRQRHSDGWRHDYYLSNASPNTPASELMRVIQARHRIEECFQRAKSEAGLADYEVRTWRGWHHHQTLSMIATWFLTQESREGKKIDTSVECPARAADAGLVAA